MPGRKPKMVVPIVLQNAAARFHALATKNDQEHPVDRAVASVPRVARLAQQLRRANARLGRHTTDRQLFIHQQDVGAAYRAVRDETYFAAGLSLGIAAGRSDALLPTKHGRVLAERIRIATLLATVSWEEAVVVLLEGLRAVILERPTRRAAPSSAAPTTSRTAT
jgi:hypothetical protein